MYSKRKRSIQPNNKAPRGAPLFGSSFSFVIMVTCRKTIFLTQLLLSKPTVNLEQSFTPLYILG